MPTVPEVEPTTFTAGDTVVWTRQLRDYHASAGWALSYSFRHETGGGKIDLTSSGTDDTFTTTIPAASSSLLNAGTWQWEAYSSKAGERYTIARGSTIITPNLFATNFNYDLRTSKKKAYDNAREAMEKIGRAHV